MSTAILTLSSLDPCKRVLQDWRMHMGDRIKARREALSLDQGDVAEPFGITREAVANWERGINQPRTKKLVKLAVTLRCDVPYLLGKQEAPTVTKDDADYIAKMLSVPPAARPAMERVADALLGDLGVPPPKPRRHKGGSKKGR